MLFATARALRPDFTVEKLVGIAELHYTESAADDG